MTGGATIGSWSPAVKGTAGSVSNAALQLSARAVRQKLDERRPSMRIGIVLGGIVVAFILSVPIAWCGFAIWWSMSTYDYGFSEMDWNGDGSVSPGEIFASMDIGASGHPGSCREFFSLKDGVPIRIICPDGRSLPAR